MSLAWRLESSSSMEYNSIVKLIVGAPTKTRVEITA